MNSIKLIIKIKFIIVDLGDIFINIILKLLIIENFIDINHKIKVIFKVNIILLEGENIIGIKFNKFIIKINLIILFKIKLLDLL